MFLLFITYFIKNILFFICENGFDKILKEGLVNINYYKHYSKYLPSIIKLSFYLFFMNSLFLYFRLVLIKYFKLPIANLNTEIINVIKLVFNLKN